MLLGVQSSLMYCVHHPTEVADRRCTAGSERPSTAGGAIAVEEEEDEE